MGEEKEVIKYIIKMVHIFNHWLSKYHTTTAFNWETLPNQIMGLLESKPASLPSSQVSTESSAASEQERFKEEVRKSAENFKNLVMRNKVMMFSATYCSCTVAKKSFGDLGTQFQSYEVNKGGEDGQMMMDVVEAVTGNRTVPQIFICGQLVPGGGSGLKHLMTSGQLTEILSKCCDGDSSCSQFDKYSLH